MYKPQLTIILKIGVKLVQFYLRYNKINDLRRVIENDIVYWEKIDLVKKKNFTDTLERLKKKINEV